MNDRGGGILIHETTVKKELAGESDFSHGSYDTIVQKADGKANQETHRRYDMPNIQTHRICFPYNCFY